MSEADQVIVILASYKAGIIDNAGVKVFYDITENPYLEAGIFGAIASYM